MFDVEGLLKKSNKSLLITELENKLNDFDRNAFNLRRKEECTCITEDVMMVFRKLTWTAGRTFDEFCFQFTAFIKGVME